MAQQRPEVGAILAGALLDPVGELATLEDAGVLREDAE